MYKDSKKIIALAGIFGGGDGILSFAGAVEGGLVAALQQNGLVVVGGAIAIQNTAQVLYNESANGGSGSSGGGSGGSDDRPYTIQSGGNTLNNNAAKHFNEEFGTNLNRREWGRIIESLKNERGLSPNDHGKIMSNGDYYLHGKYINNIGNYVP